MGGTGGKDRDEAACIRRRGHKIWGQFCAENGGEKSPGNICTNPPKAVNDRGNSAKADQMIIPYHKRLFPGFLLHISYKMLWRGLHYTAIYRTMSDGA